MVLRYINYERFTIWKNIRKNKLRFINKNEVYNIPWETLEQGDLIVFDKSMSKYISTNKRYRVIEFENEYPKNHLKWFTIIDDRNIRKSLRFHAQGYIKRIVEKHPIEKDIKSLHKITSKQKMKYL